MRQIHLTRTGADTLPKALKISESGDLVPKGDQLQIRVTAIGINQIDIQQRLGQVETGQLPCVLGIEVTGIVDEIGPEADSNWKGKSVIAITKKGGYSDVVCVSQKFCVLKPVGLNFADCCSVPIVYLTAWILLYRMGSVRMGDFILIGNAASELGLALIDVATHLGAKTIGISDKKHQDFLLGRGLYAFVDDLQSLHQVAMQHTENNGLDLIIDPIRIEMQDCVKLLRVGGKIGLSGTLPRNELSFIQKLIFRNSDIEYELLNRESKSIFSVSITMFLHDPRTMEFLRHIIQGLEKGWVKPFIEKTFPFQHAADAHQFIQEGCIGKVLLLVGQ